MLKLLQRVAMEPEVVSPVVNSLLRHIRTGGQSHLLRMIFRVIFHLLLHRQVEELTAYVHHILYGFLIHSMVYHLQISKDIII